MNPPPPTSPPGATTSRAASRSRLRLGWVAARGSVPGLVPGPATLTYSGLLAAGSLALATRDRPGRLAWLQWASTNLDNLQHHPVPALVGSAFLPQDHAAVWVLLALVGLGCAERVLGSARTAAVVTAGHLIGTAVSEGVLGYRVYTGALPERDRHILDVGPSFVVVAGLAAALVLGPVRTRVAVGGCLVVLAPALLRGFSGLDVAALGHVSAGATGLAGGWLLRRVDRPSAEPPDRRAPAVEPVAAPAAREP